MHTHRIKASKHRTHKTTQSLETHTMHWVATMHFRKSQRQRFVSPLICFSNYKIVFSLKTISSLFSNDTKLKDLALTIEDLKPSFLLDTVQIELLMSWASGKEWPSHDFVNVYKFQHSDSTYWYDCKLFYNKHMIVKYTVKEHASINKAIM